MAKFAVPAGCRDAMTNLHNAHTERYNRIKTRLTQARVDAKEGDRLVGAFMDTHNVLHGAVQKALSTKGTEMPDSVRDALQAASVHAGDVHSSLVKGRRGAGIGRESVAGKPVGTKMAGQKVDPQTHLLKTISDIRTRYGTQ
jgi:hypothetical protein